MTASRFAFSDLPLYGKEPGHNIRELYWAGARGVEILMDGPAWHKPRQAAASLKTALAACPVEVSIHPATVAINLAHQDETIRKVSRQAHLDALELARELGARHVVVHPGFRSSPDFPLYSAWRHASEAVEELSQIALREGLLLGLENVGYNETSLFNQEEYIFFVEQFDPQCAGYLIDTGHAHLDGWNLPDLIKQAQPRLVAMHLHDNRGDGDSHLPVGEGTIPWTAIWPRIAACGERSPLILEYEPGTPLETLAASRDLIQREIDRNHQPKTPTSTPASFPPHLLPTDGKRRQAPRSDAWAGQ